MGIVSIEKSGVKLMLSSRRSSVRIADKDGNHANRPTLAKNVTSNYIEWMITNAEIEKLIAFYLDFSDKQELASRIKLVNNFLSKTEYATRDTKKTIPLGKYKGFTIFKYEESFFSFEKILDLNIKIRITFKMGDFTLAPHMFILLPFNAKIIDIHNRDSKVSNNQPLGSGCYAIWEPAKEVICEATEALAHASEGHKRDLLSMVR